jgi:hypothetical protein
MSECASVEVDPARISTPPATPSTVGCNSPDEHLFATSASEKLISDDKATETTPPTTPSTASCNTPRSLFATPDGSMQQEGSESSHTNSPILRQLETWPDKPSIPPSVTAVSARAVSPDIAQPELDVLESREDSETVNNITAGQMPMPILYKKSVQDLGNLLQSFENKKADIMESTEEIEKAMQHSLFETLANSIIEAPAKEEISNPRKVVLGDVRLFWRTTEEINQMLEEELSNASTPKPVGSKTVNRITAGLIPSPTSSKKADIMECAEEIHYISFEQEMQQSVCERLATCVEEAPAEEKSSKPRKVAFGLVDDVRLFLHTTGETNQMLEEELSITCLSPRYEYSSEVEVSLITATDENYESGHIAVERFNERGRKVEVSPGRFIREDDGTDPWPDSESETNSVDSDDSNYWDDWNEEEKSIATAEIPFSNEVKHMISDLGATFARVGSELGQRFNMSGFTNCDQSNYPGSMKPPQLNPDEIKLGMSWLSRCHGDNALSKYGSPRDDDSGSLIFGNGSSQSDQSGTLTFDYDDTGTIFFGYGSKKDDDSRSSSDDGSSSRDDDSRSLSGCGSSTQDDETPSLLDSGSSTQDDESQTFSCASSSSPGRLSLLKGFGSPNCAMVAHTGLPLVSARQ